MYREGLAEEYAEYIQKKSSSYNSMVLILYGNLEVGA